MIAGSFGDARGPVRADAVDPTYLDVLLPAGTSFEHATAPDYTAFVYVYEGAARVGDRGDAIARGELAVLAAGESVVLANNSETAARVCC